MLRPGPEVVVLAPPGALRVVLDPGRACDAHVAAGGHELVRIP